MVKKQETQSISDAELIILRSIWDLGQGTAQEISERVCVKNQWDPATVKTFLFRLSKKGILHTQKQGKYFIYSSKLTENTVLEQLEEKLLSSIRQNQQEQVLKDLIERIPVSSKMAQELIELLENKEYT